MYQVVWWMCQEGYAVSRGQGSPSSFFSEDGKRHHEGGARSWRLHRLPPTSAPTSPPPPPLTYPMQDEHDGLSPEVLPPRHILLVPVEREVPVIRRRDQLPRARQGLGVEADEACSKHERTARHQWTM